MTMATGCPLRTAAARLTAATMTRTQYGSTTYTYTPNGELTGKNGNGDITSYTYSELRELFDEYIKRDPPEACEGDRRANEQGRERANQDCRQTCGSLRPRELPPRY